MSKAVIAQGAGGKAGFNHRMNTLDPGMCCQAGSIYRKCTCEWAGLSRGGEVNLRSDVKSGFLQNMSPLTSKHQLPLPLNELLHLHIKEITSVS